MSDELREAMARYRRAHEFCASAPAHCLPGSRGACALYNAGECLKDVVLRAAIAETQRSSSEATDQMKKDQP